MEKRRWEQKVILKWCFTETPTKQPKSLFIFNAKYFAVSQKHFCTVSFYPTWTLTFRSLHLTQNIKIHLYVKWKAKAFKLALRFTQETDKPPTTYLCTSWAWNSSTGAKLKNEKVKGKDSDIWTLWNWRLQNFYKDAGSVLKLKCSGKQLVLWGRPQTNTRADMESWPQSTFKKHLLVAVPNIYTQTHPHSQSATHTPLASSASAGTPGSAVPTQTLPQDTGQPQPQAQALQTGRLMHFISLSKTAAQPTYLLKNRYLKISVTGWHLWIVNNSLADSTPNPFNYNNIWSN